LATSTAAPPIANLITVVASGGAQEYIEKSFAALRQGAVTGNITENQQWKRDCGTSAIIPNG